MERGHVNSLKRKIGSADRLKLKQIAEELLSEGLDTPREVIDALTQRLATGEYLDQWTMGKLIVRFRDRDLYDVPHTKSMFLGYVDVLVDFLRAGIPAREIEEHLCDKLALDFDKNAYGFRQPILEALRDCGSINCLETLEMIDFDFHGRFQAARTVADALASSPFDGQNGKSPAEWGEGKLREFDLILGKLIKDAVSAVRARNLVGEYAWSDPPLQGVALFSQVDEYIALTRGHLDDDLGAALLNIRKAMESLLKTVIKLRAIKPRSSDPIEKMLLPVLIGIVMSESKAKSIDKHIHQYLTALQHSSTLGSHDQGVPLGELIDRDAVEGLLAMFNIVQKYFQDYVQEKAG